jgi:hypothetical protein
MNYGRPPSGRVKIQLDPNANEFYNNTNARKESRQSVQLLSKQSFKPKGDSLDLTDAKFNPVIALQTTSLSINN